MRHFLDIADHTTAELQSLLEMALTLKREWQQGGNAPRLQGQVLALLFEKPSLRTRVSFEVAMRHVGGDSLYLSPAEVGLGQRESVADVARVLSGYVQAIVARVFRHATLVDLARSARVPVINALSDQSHPCQALGDALTLLEHYGRIRDLRIAYVGDGNNTAVSLMQMATKLGAHVAVASPAGYDPPEALVAQAEGFAKQSDGGVSLTRDPRQAVHGADVVYTDTWVSMGQEAEAEPRMKVFPPYQVNAHLVAQAKPDAVVMHCLPAHRGQEITAEVADGPQSVIVKQAENRLHAQKALLVKLLGGDQVLATSR